MNTQHIKMIDSPDILTHSRMSCPQMSCPQNSHMSTGKHILENVLMTLKQQGIK